MSDDDAYLFYEAGQAVAAVHLGLTIRHISSNPAQAASEIVIPRDLPKARLIMWLTGMAAERKGTGTSDPLRRTRNRMRIRMQLDSLANEMNGSKNKRTARTRLMFNQSQDRANAVCSNWEQAIRQIVAELREVESLSGDRIREIVRMAKTKRSRGNGQAAGGRGNGSPNGDGHPGS